MSVSYSSSILPKAAELPTVGAGSAGAAVGSKEASAAHAALAAPVTSTLPPNRWLRFYRVVRKVAHYVNIIVGVLFPATALRGPGPE